MFIRRCVLLLTLIGATFLLAPGRAVQAGDDWLPIDPTDLKMTSEPKAPGAPAIYLYRQVDRDDKGTSSTQYNYLRIKILTEEGRKYANVEIPFDKGGYRVSGIRARTIRPDGTIVNYEGKIFENTIVKSKTLKYLAKTFSMPEASVGSIIEYRFNYDFADYQIFNSRWILSEELFTKHAKFSLKPYVGEGWSVQWVSPAGLPGGTEQAKEGPDHILLVRPRVLGNWSSDVLERKEPRKYPVEFDGPAKNIDSYEIKLPEGYTVDDLPPPVDADYSFASYHSKTEAKGNVLTYTRTMEIKELSVPVEKLEQLKSFYRVIVGDERNTAVLKPAGK